ncbi:MAG: dipeptidase, partial [Thermomicrobiales bacterium]
MSDASQQHVSIFDGHNDTVLSLRGTGRSFFNHTDQGHIDLPRARAGGLAGGIFAVFVPAPRQAVSSADPGAAADLAAAQAVQSAAPEEKPGQAQQDAASQGETSVIPPPPGLTHEYALTFAMTEFARLFQIEAQSGGEVTIVRSARELRECIANGTFAMQLHFEGAEAIDTDLNALAVFHAAGLRSLGIVWSRSNAFGHGVPFGVGSPDTGPGLT